jgi:hypothetical protein
MPYSVTTRKRGGFEYTSAAENEAAALVLAQMMRRAGEEYCDEAKVIVRDAAGEVVAAWRGSSYGWQPVPLSKGAAATRSGLQPLPGRAPAGAPRVAQSLFARMPTMPSDPSLITEHSAA